MPLLRFCWVWSFCWASFPFPDVWSQGVCVICFWAFCYRIQGEFARLFIVFVEGTPPICTFRHGVVHVRHPRCGLPNMFQIGMRSIWSLPPSLQPSCSCHVKLPICTHSLSKLSTTNDMETPWNHFCKTLVIIFQDFFLTVQSYSGCCSYGISKLDDKSLKSRQRRFSKFFYYFSSTGKPEPRPWESCFYNISKSC